MMVRYDHQFIFLYRILDESGLEWLSDEIRSFALSYSQYQVLESEVAAMRDISSQKSRHEPRLNINAEDRSGIATEPKSFDECIQYLTERIDNIAAYLEAGINVAKELGISKVQLGLEASEQADLSEAVQQLRSVNEAIRGRAWRD